MKKSLILLVLPLFLLSLANDIKGQAIGINAPNPDASSILEMIAADRGLLIPRMADKSAVAAPATGLLVYQTGAPAGFYYYDGSAWLLVSSTAAGILPVVNGGTGQSSYTDGQLLIGNTTGNTLAKATLTGTADQVIVTNGGGSITLSTPQSINTTSSPTFVGLTLSGLTASGLVFTDGSKNLSSTAAGILPSANGGTGIDNGGRTLTVNTNSGTIDFTGASKTLTVPLDASVSGTNTGDNAANSSTMFIGTTSVALNRASAALALTGITSIDGSAATWTTARNLAGNSVNGSADVAFANKFIVQGTTDAGLTGAQFLGGLGTGIVKNTTTTGVLSIAVAGDFPTLNQNTTGTANIAGGTVGAIPYQTAANTTGVLAATATANQVLLSGANAAPTWSTATYPATIAIGEVPYGSAANVISKLANSATTGTLFMNTSGAAPSWTTLTSLPTTAGILPSANGGTGIDNGGRTLTVNTNSGTIDFTGAAKTLTVPLDASVSGTNTGDNAANSSTMFIGTTSVALNRASAALALTGITSVDGSAATWTTARNLAGNNVDGSADVAFANKFIVQGTADAGLTGAQFLGSLATGIVKNTTTTGILSIAVAGDFPTLNQNTTGTANIAGGTAGAIPYQTAANTTGVLAATATANQVLLSGANTAPSWSTATYPATIAIGEIPYGSAANIISTLANSATTGTLFMNTSGAAPSWTTLTSLPATAGILPIANGGTGSSTQNFVDLTTAQTAAGAKTWSALGTFSLGITSTGAAVNLNVSSNFGTNINTGNSTGAVAIGNAATTGITANVGTGNFSLDGTTGSTYTMGASTTTGTTTIGGTAQTGTMTFGSSSGTNIVNVGTGTGATTVNVATGATNAKTINIANGAASTVNVANGAFASTITIGNVTGATGISQKVGTGNYVLDGVTNSNYTIGESTTTGTTTIGGTAQTGTMTFGSSSGTNIVNVGTGAGNSTVNIATGAGTNPVNIATGSTTSTVKIGGDAGAVAFKGILSASAVLDFANTGNDGVSDLTITVTGAADGDPVFLGVPNGSIVNGVFWAWVSAANTVTVRFSSNQNNQNPASGTFRVTVFHY